jgi:hypothetical protein
MPGDRVKEIRRRRGGDRAALNAVRDRFAFNAGHAYEGIYFAEKALLELELLGDGRARAEVGKLSVLRMEFHRLRNRVMHPGPTESAVL